MRIIRSSSSFGLALNRITKFDFFFPKWQHQGQKPFATEKSSTLFIAKTVAETCQGF